MKANHDPGPRRALAEQTNQQRLKTILGPLETLA